MHKEEHSPTYHQNQYDYCNMLNPQDFGEDGTIYINLSPSAYLNLKSDDSQEKFKHSFEKMQKNTEQTETNFLLSQQDIFMDNEANLEMSAYDLRQQGSQSNFNKKLNQKNSPLKLIPFSRQNYDRNLLKELQLVGDYTYETDKKNQIFYEDNASPNVSAKKEPSTDMSSDENYNKFTASQVKENTKVSRKSKKIKSKKKMVKKSDTENSENHDSGSAQIQYLIEHACDF